MLPLKVDFRPTNAYPYRYEEGILIGFSGGYCVVASGRSLGLYSVDKVRLKEPIKCED